jgi:hypothetical protein
MLCDVVSCEDPIVVPKKSTKFVDAVVERWTRKNIVYPATLVSQKDRWKEFWLNASDVSNWCPRSCAISALFGPRTYISNFEDLWNMGQGTSYHNLFQKELFPTVFKGELVGSWGLGNKIAKIRDDRVVLEDRDSVDLVTDIDVFGDYDKREIVRPWMKNPWYGSPVNCYYVEPKIRIPKYRIVTKLDGIIDFDGLEIQEIKTEKEMARDSIDPARGGNPRSKHVEQVQVMMWSTGIRKARLIYIFKGAMTFSQSILEFEISYDEDIINRLKMTALACIEAVQKCDEWKANNSLEIMVQENYDIERLAFLETFERQTECPMKSKGRAQNCPERDGCFPGRGKKKT